MVERISTGISLLDEDLQGGFPAESTILIIGDKNTGINQLVNHFIYSGLQKGEEDLYITLNKQPSDVKDNSEHYGWNLEEDGDLTFVDGYSWQMDEPESPFAVTGLSDLNEISMTVIDALNSIDRGPKRTAFNSVTSLLNYMNIGPATKLTKVISSKANKNGGVMMITMYDSVHEDQMKERFKNAVDGVILLKQKKNTTYLGVDQMTKTDHATEWRKLGTSSDKGIVLQK